MNVSVFNLPNGLTVLRLLLVPFIGLSLVAGAYREAFVCFVIAGVTDLLDGLLARHFQQQTRFGAMLDPAADKAMIVAFFTALTILGMIPLWLTILVVLRDVFIVTGAVNVYLTNKPMVLRPLWVSKANTLAQILYLALMLAILAYEFPIKPYVDSVGYVVAALTGLSFLAYLRLWVRFGKTFPKPAELKG